MCNIIFILYMRIKDNLNDKNPKDIFEDLLF